MGATLDEARIPVAAAARRLSLRDGRSPILHALTDGEDYELLFTVPAKESKGLRSLIGRIERQRGLRLRRKDGRVEPLEVRGWEHRWM